jgi:hypothetical protein
MDPLSLSGLIRLLNLEIESLVKLENINIDSLVKFEMNLPIYIMPRGVRIDSSDGAEIANLPAMLLLPQRDKHSGLVGPSRALPIPGKGNTTDGESSTIQFPFSQGLHYVISEHSWWSDGKQITLGNTKLIPAQYDKDLSITRIGPGRNQPSFRLHAKVNQNVMFAALSAEPLTSINSAIPYQEGSEIWRFTWYHNQSAVLLGDEPSTIVSFSPTVVSAALLIEFERIERPPIVRYLLVFPVTS